MDDARNTDENPCGKFGYEILCQNQYIPYIFRGDKKFCATKVIQCHIDKFNVNFNPILNKFPYLTGYEMYEREAFLWNDINIWHNNNKYPIFFRTGDTLMQLSDVCDIFQFIEDCNQKSKLGDRYEMVSGAGLMQIQWTTTENGELMDTVWPYILKGKKRYVPVEFLNGSCTLSSTIVLNGIVIMYMRYLYTVLKREIPKKDEQMVCVELDEALAHSLSNNDHTYHFNENYWPTQKRPALKVPSLPPLLTLENHIKKLNNNNLAFFSKTHTNVDQTKMSSGKVATVTAAAPVISSEKVNDTSENARKVESNTKTSLRKRPAAKKSTQREKSSHSKKEVSIAHYYEVDGLIDFKVEKGKELVLVQWKGCYDDSWEPVTNMNDKLLGDVAALREKYEKQKSGQNNKKNKSNK